MDSNLKERLMKIIHLIVRGDIEINDEVLLQKMLSHIQKLKSDVSCLPLEEMNLGQLICELISNDAESLGKSFGIKFISIALKFARSSNEEILNNIRLLLDHWTNSSALQEDASFCVAILEMLLTIAQNELFIESLLSKECFEVSTKCLQSKNLYIRTAAQNFLSCIISKTASKEKATKFPKISVISKEILSCFLDHLMEVHEAGDSWRRSANILLPVIKGLCLQNEDIAEDLRLPLLKSFSHNEKSIQSSICEIYAIILASVSPTEQKINEFIRLLDDQLLIQKFSGCMLLKLEAHHGNVSNHLQELILLPLQSKKSSLKDLAAAIENLKHHLVVLTDNGLREKAAFDLCRVLEDSFSENSSFGLQRLHVALLDCFLHIIKNGWPMDSDRGHQLARLLLLILEKRNVQGLILTKSVAILGHLIKRNVWTEVVTETTGTDGNDSPHKFGQCLTSFLCHPDWEIRDSTVELVGHLAEVTQTSKQIEDLLLQNCLPQMVWEQLEFELESFVRSSILTTLLVFIEVPIIWNSLMDKYSKEVIVLKILHLLQEDSEEIVRRSACKLLSSLYLREDTHVYQKSIRAAMQLSMKDFDWEVKLEALEFWKRMFISLRESHGLINAFEEGGENEKFKKLLDKLNREGFCFSLLQAVDDCDVCVKLKAVQILQMIKKGLNRSDLFTNRQEHDLPPLKDQMEEEEKDDATLPPLISIPFNYEVVESILQRPDRDTIESLMVKQKKTEEKEKDHPLKRNVEMVCPDLFLEKLYDLDVEAMEKELQKSTDLHEESLSCLLDDLLPSEKTEENITIDCY